MLLISIIFKWKRAGRVRKKIPKWNEEEKNTIKWFGLVFLIKKKVNDMSESKGLPCSSLLHFKFSVIGLTYWGDI